MSGTPEPNTSDNTDLPPEWVARAARVAPGGEAYWRPEVALEILDEFANYDFINLGIDLFKPHGSGVMRYGIDLDLGEYLNDIAFGDLDPAAVDALEGSLDEILAADRRSQRRGRRWRSWEQFNQAMEKALIQWPLMVRASVVASKRFIAEHGKEAAQVTLCECNLRDWTEIKEKQAQSDLAWWNQ